MNILMMQIWSIDFHSVFATQLFERRFIARFITLIYSVWEVNNKICVKRFRKRNLATKNNVS